jgi:ubiquinone/menaquinone biosynthesis C-methylase UbiE
MSLKDNIEFEKGAWRKTGVTGNSSGPRYVLDTVLYHETNTDALYKIQRGLELAKDKDVLEVGCNCGGFCFLFAKTAKSVLGLDLLPEPIAFARKFRDWINAGDFTEETWGEKWCHPPDWKMDNVGFTQGNGYDLPIRDESIDVVFMYSCIEHFPMHQRLKSVQEAKRVTRKDGLVVVSTITDVDNEKREEWLKQIAEEVHPFGLSSLSDIVDYAKDAGLVALEANETWFGDQNKIKLAFVVLQRVD